jgi:hypothetical protein
MNVYTRVSSTKKKDKIYIIQKIYKPVIKAKTEIDYQIPTVYLSKWNDQAIAH